MELRHLRYFVAVTEEGSLTEAARRRLHVSQPSLSRQIHDLELELGKQLFERRVNGVELTASGRVLLIHARRILEQVEGAIIATTKAAPVLRIGSLPGLELEVIPRTRSILSQIDARTEIYVTSASSPRLVEGLRAGQLDMVFMRPLDEAPDIRFHEVGRHRIVAFMPREHPLVTLAAITFQDLKEFPHIAVARVSAPTVRRAIDLWERQHGESLGTPHSAANISSALSLMLLMGAPCLLPEYAAGLASDAIVSRPLVDAPEPLPYSIAWRPANHSSASDAVEAIMHAWSNCDEGTSSSSG